MGMSTIGFMVSVPKEIGPEKREAAVQAVKARFAELIRPEKVNEMFGEETAYAEVEAAARERVEQDGLSFEDAVAEEIADGLFGTDDYEGAARFLENVSRQGDDGIRKLVDQVADFCESPDARDTNARSDPHFPAERWYIFSGEPTWGDEPGGHGYTTFQMAFDMGIDEILGIK